MSESLKRTAVSFAIECSKYIPGLGYKTVLEPIKTIVGYDDEGNPLYSEVFYVSWQEKMGSNSIIQQQNNIVQTANLQMTYVKEVAAALYLLKYIAIVIKMIVTFLIHLLSTTQIKH